MNDIADVLVTPGSIAVIPTDTVYGVVARASDRQAVQRLYQLKHRERKPGTLIAANIEQLVELGIPRRYVTAVAQFWPGPVSVILPCGDNLSYLHDGRQSLAVRIPDDASLNALLTKTGPLMTSSANQPGEPPATTVAQARDYFSEAIDAYADGGDLSGRKPSTVIRMIDDAIEVIREGAVIINENGRIEP